MEEGGEFVLHSYALVWNQYLSTLLQNSCCSSIVGATNFPDLEIAVTPKIGRAVLWPSVLDSNPYDKEPRTDHEAQDVIKGLKYGANAWLHMHDYMAAQELGCT